ncbi:MAG: hypothetical protein AB7V55_07640 [Oscillospiraceae bacterium]
MDTIAEICRLMEAKKERFFEYEKATLAMLECGPDDVEHYITQRGELAIEIDALTEQIARLASEEPAAELLVAAAAGRAEFAQLPPEYHCVFYEAQSVQSVANRIRETEKQVLARLNMFKDEALANIRQNQNLPKIKKYLTDLSGKNAQGSLTDEKA